MPVPKGAGEGSVSAPASFVDTFEPFGGGGGGGTPTSIEYSSTSVVFVLCCRVVMWCVVESLRGIRFKVQVCLLVVTVGLGIVQLKHKDTGSTLEETQNSVAIHNVLILNGRQSIRYYRISCTL